MKRLDELLGAVAFDLTALVLLASPWLFGAWEMWWFWPFAVLIFCASGCLALRLVLCARLGVGNLYLNRPARYALLFYLPFLAYGLVRALMADVFMDAERSVLLHITPVLLGGLLVFGASSRQLKALALLLLADFLLLGLYGIGSHLLDGSRHVLWRPGYPQYQEVYHRATGSYFCPDHFAGLMELGLALALGFLLARRTRPALRAAAALLALVAVAGVVLTKSRGGGLALAVIGAAALAWGLVQYPPRLRWRLRAAAATAAALGAVALLTLGSHYGQRFREYPWTRLQQSERYQMAAGALRAWATAPALGIGPGMHQHLWPHFAASPDGDRAAGRWPRTPNTQFNSYEVHSDWVQLLEEYGALGLILFLGALVAVGRLLAKGWQRESREQERAEWSGSNHRDFALVLAGLLAAAAMGFHSLGDFNLQIPATAWLLAALVAIPVALVSRERAERSRSAPAAEPEAQERTEPGPEVL